MSLINSSLITRVTMNCCHKTILNTNPTLDTITLSPDPVYVSDDITCIVSASDIDEDVSSQITIEIQDGQGTVLSSVTGLSSLSLDISTTSLLSGDTIACYGLVQDAYGGSDSSTTSLVVSNSAPIFDAAASISFTSANFARGAPVFAFAFSAVSIRRQSAHDVPSP